MTRVVIVDDSHLARLELKAQIEELGGLDVVGEAPDIIEAKVVIEQEQPDLLLLDINMPSGQWVRLIGTINLCASCYFCHRA